MKRVGKGGHQRALRILNMRSTFNLGPDTILLDLNTVIIQKYFTSHVISSFYSNRCVLYFCVRSMCVFNKVLYFNFQFYL